MRSQGVQVLAAVSEHWLIGALTSSGVRIQDILNDGGTDFIRLSDVRVFRQAELESCRATLPELVVPKSKVEFVIILPDRHEAAVKRVDNQVTTSTSKLFLIIGGYRIRGTLHLPGTPSDSQRVLSHRVTRFFPVTQASISLTDAEQWGARVLIANREFVNCIYVGESVGEEPKASLPPEECEPEENLLSLMDNLQGMLAGNDAGSDPAKGVGSLRDVMREVVTGRRE